MSEEDIFQSVKVSITVSNVDGEVIYMNDASKAVFGDMLGKSMIPCHQQRSQDIIHKLIAQKETHAYTIQKGEVRKLIYQTPWYKDGKLAGLVEFSLILPDEVPHYVREVKK